jgi:hypothetical protein
MPGCWRHDVTTWWSRLRRVPAPVVDAGLAVALAVALATAWVAGHRRWSLLIVAFYVAGPFAWFVFQLWARASR